MGPRDEGGQLLALAGVVLVLAFLLSAFAVSEIAAEQQRLQRGPQGEVPELFRETREKVAVTMSGLAFPTIDNSTLMQLFNATALDLEQQGRGHGVQVVLRLAGADDPWGRKSEWNLTLHDPAAYTCPGTPAVTRLYNLSSHNASRDYTAVSYDCGNDGILWDRDLGQARGILLYLFLADRDARIDQTFAIAVN